MILVLIICLHIFLLTHLKFTAWPEMLSYPYLFLNKFQLYKDFIMPYPPILVFYLSVFYKLFGITIETLKASTYLLSAATDVVLFYIFKSFTKDKITPFSFLVTYILIQSLLDGNMMWFDNAMVFPVGLAFLTLPTNVFISGFILGIAVLVKQTSIYFLFPCLIYLLTIRKLKESKNFVLSLSIPLILFLIYLFKTGSLSYFWKWSIWYPFTEWVKFPGYVQFNISRSYIFILLLLTVPLVMSIKILYKKNLRNERVFLSILFLIAAIVAIYPRFSFFHLQTFIFFATVIYFLTFINLSRVSRILESLLLVIAILFIAKVVLPYNLNQTTRFYEKGDLDLANMIRGTTKPGEKILLLNINSSQYVYTNTLPPKPWLDNFGWYLEIPGVQKWVIKDWAISSPEIIVRKPPLPGNWFDLGTYEPKEILNYVYDNYTQKYTINNIEVWTKK